MLPLPATVPKQVGDSKNMSNVLVEDFNEETSKTQGECWFGCGMLNPIDINI